MSDYDDDDENSPLMIMDRHPQQSSLTSAAVPNRFDSSIQRGRTMPTPNSMTPQHLHSLDRDHSPSPARKNKSRKRIVKYFFEFSASFVSGAGLTSSVQDGEQPSAHPSPTTIQPDKYVIKATKKFGPSSLSLRESSEEEIDENSVALLCLPDGISVVNVPIDPQFHFFVITKQDGTRIYGSALIFWELVEKAAKSLRHHSSIKNNKYASTAYCLLTTIPFVLAAKKLLVYFWKCKCDPILIDTVCNLKLPAKGKCIKLRLPPLPQETLYDVDSQTFGFEASELAEIFVYRGISELPLFDHSLRELFINVLPPSEFFKAFAALLLEFQVLIVSHDYYRLMLVAESLTALILPFKWQHVYVPILPPKLGLHYLDAPTPYIMGIKASPGSNTSASLSISHSVQCRVDCDSGRAEFCFSENTNTDSKTLRTFLPPFIKELAEEVNELLKNDPRLIAQAAHSMHNRNEILKNVVDIARRHDMTDEKLNYLDELKFNQKIRVVCIRAMKKNILRNFERFIVNAQHRRDSVKFDVVSYLCDQPDSMKPFLSKFLETQMFASFIDEAASKLRKAKQSLFTSSSSSILGTSLTTSTSSTAFHEDGQNQIILVDDLNHTDESDRISDFNDDHLDTVFACAHDVDLSENRVLPGNQKYLVKVTSSPVRQRMKQQQMTKSLTLASGQHLGSLSTSHHLRTIMDQTKELNASPLIESQLINASPAHLPSALASHTNWRVVECLLREVTVKTKRILLAKMGNEEIAPLGCGSISEVDENTLIASLCDLIERVWSHGVKAETSNAFWQHLSAYARTESGTSGAGSDSNTRSHNSDSSYLAPAWMGFFRKRIDSLSNMALDAPNKSRSMPASPAKRSSSSRGDQTSSPHRASSNLCHDDPFKSLPATLLYDYRSIQAMGDVTSDLGKSRAFIRLALERKLLSAHLRTLLAKQDLLDSMYKRYAFLRSDEEREQFLTHLLTLNAVDLRCFTSTFTLTKNKHQYGIWRKKYMYKDDL